MQVPIQCSRYGPVQPAFVEKGCGPPKVDVCLGPVSKVIDGCMSRHQSSGQCWGTFESHWCDQKDTSLSCLQDHNLVKVDAYHQTGATNEVGSVGGSAAVNMASQLQTAAGQGVVTQMAPHVMSTNLSMSGQAYQGSMQQY